MATSEKKKVLLVGAGGLTGNAFLRLSAEKYDIIQLTKENTAEISSLVKGNFYAVIYLAQSADYKSGTFTENLFEVNVYLLHRVLHSTACNSTRFIYFSSGSVYDFRKVEEVDESGTLNFASGNPYIASKLIGEELVRSFEGKFAKIHIVRPFFIYGAHQKPSMLFSVIKQKLLSGQEIELASGAGLIFNPIFVDDAAASIGQLLEASSDGTVTTVNLFGKEETDLASVTNGMASLLSVTPKVRFSEAPAKRMIAKTLTPYIFGNTGLREGLNNFLRDE